VILTIVASRGDVVEVELLNVFDSKELWCLRLGDQRALFI
jgi:hypothetical protein